MPRPGATSSSAPRWSRARETQCLVAFAGPGNPRPARVRDRHRAGAGGGGGRGRRTLADQGVHRRARADRVLSAGDGGGTRRGLCVPATAQRGGGLRPGCGAGAYRARRGRCAAGRRVWYRVASAGRVVRPHAGRNGGLAADQRYRGGQGLLCQRARRRGGQQRARARHGGGDAVAGLASCDPLPGVPARGVGGDVGLPARQRATFSRGARGAGPDQCVPVRVDRWPQGGATEPPAGAIRAAFQGDVRNPLSGTHGFAASRRDAAAPAGRPADDVLHGHAGVVAGCRGAGRRYRHRAGLRVRELPRPFCRAGDRYHPPPQPVPERDGLGGAGVRAGGS